MQWSANRRRSLLGPVGAGEIEGLWIVSCEVVHTSGMRLSIVHLDRNSAKEFLSFSAAKQPDGPPLG